jgi:hypothetical protein
VSKPDKIQIDLIKLDSGKRLLRLTDLLSGMALEYTLDAHQSVVRQKNQLLRIFKAVLQQADLTPA